MKYKLVFGDHSLGDGFDKNHIYVRKCCPICYTWGTVFYINKNCWDVIRFESRPHMCCLPPVIKLDVDLQEMFKGAYRLGSFEAVQNIIDKLNE